MNEIQNNINSAMALLKKISVREDDVERMASAKILLEIAFRLAGKMEKTSPEETRSEPAKETETAENTDGEEKTV